MKSGNLNFLEPSGPLQACNGTALPSCILLYVGLCFEDVMWPVIRRSFQRSLNAITGFFREISGFRGVEDPKECDAV
jgi:hypothetical protein